MLYRKIAAIIEQHLLSDSKKIMLIDGARQIGKTYIIRHMVKKCFENFIEINMVEDSLGDKLFEKTSKPSNYDAKKRKQFKAQIGRIENMAYDEMEDCFTCARGKKLFLWREYTELVHGQFVTTAWYRCENCRNCPQRNACCKANVRTEMFLLAMAFNLKKLWMKRENGRLKTHLSEIRVA